MKRFIIAFVIFILQSYSIKASVYEYQLVNDLFTNYSSNVRPAINHANPTQVYISVGLSQILDVDDQNQIITVYLWVTLFWNDPMLAWNPLNYNNLTDIVVSASDVWKPDLTMNQPAEKVVFNSDYDNVRLNYQGSVSWFPNGAFKLYCQINAEYFPYDEQNCSFVFISQSLSTYQLDLVIYSNLIMSFYLNNTEWDYVNTTSIKQKVNSGPFPMQSVTFYIRIRRKPLYLIISYILPCVTTLAVSFLAFFVPAESGEKMSISVTCLLSLLVLWLVVSAVLPPTSSSFALIGLFYSAAIAINALISLTSVTILNIHHYGEIGKPVPINVQKIFFSLFGKIIMFPKYGHIDVIRSKGINSQVKETSVLTFDGSNNDSVDKKNSNIQSEVKEKSVILSDKSGDFVEEKKNKSSGCIQSFKDSVSKIFRSNKIGGTDSIENAEIDKEQAQLQWTLLADIIERLLFYIFLFVSIFSLLGIVNIAPYAKIFTS